MNRGESGHEEELRMNIVMTFKVDRIMKEMILAYSNAMGITASELIRQSIRFYMSRHKPEPNHVKIKVVEVV